MSVISDFKARFGEFDAADVDAYLPGLIDEYPCYYGGDYSVTCDKVAILYLLAHMLVGEIGAQTSSDPSQVVASRSVGNVSESYFNGNVTGDNAYFMGTKYGRRYQQLVKKNAGAVWV